MRRSDPCNAKAETIKAMGHSRPGLPGRQQVLDFLFPQETPMLKFHNQLAVREIRIGVHEFYCIGVLPPHDHPHVYLTMDSSVPCPYCSTLFRFDPHLGVTLTDPPGCHFEE